MTPETLRPAAPPAPTIELPETAGPTAPVNAAKLSVSVGTVAVEGTFPEFQAETAALVDRLIDGLPHDASSHYLVLG